jgi:mRNA interferase MazF
MALKFNPRKGQILMCDFTVGFKPPEAVKNRPVVVWRCRNGLATVVVLSTVAPFPVEKYHMKIPRMEMPRTPSFSKGDSWLKGDMIYSVGLERLDLIELPKAKGRAKREYFLRRLDLETLKKIERCILWGIGLSRLEKFLD